MKAERMKHENKKNYLRIALALQGISVNSRIADQIIETYEGILELKGKFSIKDAVDIEVMIENRYKEKEEGK